MLRFWNPSLCVGGAGPSSSPNSNPICYHTSPDTSANSTRPCESQGHEGYYDEDGSARNGASDEKNDADDLFATKNDRFIIEDHERVCDECPLVYGVFNITGLESQ